MQNMKFLLNRSKNIGCTYNFMKKEVIWRSLFRAERHVSQHCTETSLSTLHRDMSLDTNIDA